MLDAQKVPSPKAGSSSQVLVIKRIPFYKAPPKGHPRGTSSTPQPPQVGRFGGADLLTLPLFQTPAPVQDERRHEAGLEQPSSSGLGPLMAQISLKQTLQVG